MGNNSTNFRRIGTFAEYCKIQDKLPIRENNEVAIDVPFYNEAIDDIIGSLHYTAGTPIDWHKLIDYIKFKFRVIDREVPGGDECLVLAHVRDLLFQRYGDTFVAGDFGGLTFDAAAAGTKCLVLSQIATDILHKVRVEAGLETPPEPEIEPKPISTVTMDYYDCDDDGYYEKVVGYGDFSRLLQESVDKLSIKHGDKALKYCLKILKEKVGSIKYDDIIKVVEDEKTTLNDYLAGIAEEYLKTAEIELNGIPLKDKGDQKILLQQAKKLYANYITKDLVEKIKKETI